MKNKNKQTKFPVARIKRIMQKDEEVGKVAQGTPIVISKALELFLSMIIDEANKVTAERGSKRVEAYHLKHAVETVDMLDFLKEIVEAVPDPSAGGTVDLEQDAPDGKRKRGKGKKVPTADDDDEAAAPKRRRRKADPTKPPRKRRGVKDEEIEREDEADEGEGEVGGVGSGSGRKQEEDDDEWE